MDQRNMILAFVLSMAVLLGWGLLFPPPAPAPQTVADNNQLNTQEADPLPDEAVGPELRPAVSVPGQPVPATDHAVTSRSTADGKTVTPEETVFTLSNDVLQLEINHKGWLTRATLPAYRQSLAATSEAIAVLEVDESHAMYANSGILGARLEKPFTLVKKAAHHILLRGTLDNGHIWQRDITLSPGSYMIDVEDRIQKGAGLKMFHQVVERHPNKESSTFYEHNGPVALLEDKLKEVSYEDLDEAGTIRSSAIGGWTGIMNRYFISAIIANRDQDYPYYFKGDGRAYQAGAIDDGQLEGDTAVFRSRLFIGPKSIPLLETLNVGLERCVDFGWFAVIAKPLHELLLWFYNYLPNYGLCIILLVLLIKALFFWPTQKSYQSMAGMRKLQPEQNRLKELYGDDRQKMGQEMMALYKKHKVNPLGGCLPIIIQIPVFFALYKVLLMSIEMRQAPFFAWIHDLSAQDPYFVLPVLMGISMFVQQRLNPQPPDPIQAKVMQFLPIMFTVMFLFFPAGLVLYWVVNNVLSIIQQRVVMKGMGVK
ncbi:MAG: membrane protein insertase YidC [Mariprofundaceae bacterium]